jgi:SAM-dependent methyltransferase
LPALGSPGTTFGRVAEAYHRTRPGYSRGIVDRAAAELGLTHDARVLDLGAGTGSLTRTLRDVFAHVAAVEPDEQMRAHFEGDVQPGSAEQIPFPDDSFDAVFAGESFHWFDHETAIAEIRRVAPSIAILMRSWGETEQPGLLPPSTWAELDELWARFHGETTREEFYDWRKAVPPDGTERFEETVRISGRDLVDLHLTASTPASIPDAEREAIAERAYPSMDDAYDLRVVTYLYWKRFE